jgi:hypothetical protein
LKIINFLSVLLFGSAICLSAGGVLLYRYNLVRLDLLQITAVAVIIIIPLSFLVCQKNLLAINIATILGFIAPTISLTTPAHLQVLLEFGQSWLISILGLLQFLGFYLFPVTYLVLRFAYRRRISAEVDAKRTVLGSHDSQKKIVRTDEQAKQ